MGSILAEQLKHIMQSLYEHHRYAAMFYDMCCLFFIFVFCI